MEENSSDVTILDILELAHSLRQEKLSIETEMNDYFRLQMKLNENSFLAFKTAWITSLHRMNLNTLIISKPENRPSMCCQRATQLEYTEFVDAHKFPTVKYQHLPQYIELLRLLHQSPTILAKCLAIADDLSTIGSSSPSAKSEQMHLIAQVVSAGLYGNCIHGRDVEMMLKLLERLLELKLQSIEVPRRIFRLSSSSFAKLYHKFHESSLSSKLFLTTALHEPVMSVLVDDTGMLDFDDITRSNREENIEKLLQLSNVFITSLSDNWIIFPSTIRWLVQSMSHILFSRNFDQKVIHEILIDMVFGNFICPAVVSPDLYGICDAPISENARFNLIQIGQILQTLALTRTQEVDNKFAELIRSFENQNVISNLMDQLLENTYDISEMGLSHQLPTLYNIGRNCILMTPSEVNLLMQFLRSSLNHESDDEELKKFKEMMNKLPNLIEHSTSRNQPTNGNVEVSPSKRTSKLMQQLSNKGNKSKITKNQSDENLSGNNNGNSNDSNPIDRVIIIPLSAYENCNKVRPLSEDEVLNMNQTVSDRTDNGGGSLTEKNIEEMSRLNEDEEKEVNKEKQARFSMNQDDVSIGNTSDNLELEAVSEAPSNHSVASSLDLEENNDNDNLSDMVSANVSGRGTPNISGRDTPSSQVIDGGEVPQIPTPQMAKIIIKARNDIDDKFCKFEIKKLLEGDETISIISDTWSTDVLASDSETIEANDRNFVTPLIPSSIILPDSFQPRSQIDMSETQSESAWSTDVLIASDSEKNTEIDNDDTQSITTRSDITETRDQVPYINFRPIDPSNLTPRESPFSTRSTDDSPRFGEMPRPRGFRPHPGFLSTPQSLTQPRPFRQHSNESQSSAGLDETPKSPMREKRIPREFIDQQPLSVFRVIDPNLENFEDSKVIKTSINLINPFASSSNDSTIDGDVECRRLSEEDRSMNYDSRRNGMIDFLSSTGVSTTTNESSVSDDVKQQQIVKAKSIDVDGDLSAKVESLKIESTSSTSTGAISKIANGSVKNSKSTGAIPKSISFDSTADKAEKRSKNRRQMTTSSGNGGFINKIKSLARNKNRERHSVNENFPIDHLTNGSPSHRIGILPLEPTKIDLPDEILKKYQRKPSTSSDAATSDSAGSNNSSSFKSKSSDNENRSSNAHNLQNADFFLNAKRKLRLVLSTSDCHACDVRNNNRSTMSPLLSYLQIQLAQAMNQQNLQQVSYVSELLRSLSQLDSESHYRLVRELQKDTLERQSYLQYLIRLRQDLLSTIATIENFQKRLDNDRTMCNRHLVMVCVRMFLEKREPKLNIFQEEFNLIPAVDEKLELMEELIVSLMEDLKNDNIIQGMADWQLIEARNCIERILLQRLYHQVMFPNDDVDISNDQLLHDCIKKLSLIITPSHSGLKIPHRYLNEAPWPFAQQQISYISAYKTPQEKVQCVVRCIQSILYLLKMASNQHPAADDLVPVLIYVIIKANPPFLQSTINYVEAFIGSRLQGEDHYWWTIFTSAIQFIKTLIEGMEKNGHRSRE